MKAVYFDIFSGISGNMVLGALLDAGLKLDILKKELAKLGLTEYEIDVKEVVKGGIKGTYVEVQVEEHNEDNHHTHGRHLADIEAIIDESELDVKIKKLSKKIFNRLAKAEAKIHNTTIYKIHFHEVGAVDAIIDIVGAVIGIEALGIEEIYASRVHTGTGFVNCDHGKIPVPVPATLELLQEVPVYSTGIKNELVTPTGAAIITTLAKKFGNMPLMQTEQIGYGAGSRELEIPNLLRLRIGNLE
ncbi:hypothetical protein SAMN02745118_00829 [Selenihalanaerobacter shriftii]|uniref:TIGR00299 family protein n=1 Tax=Selenihalanaerobacter shriftii TaxID=142842 RepID=A0A1T4KLF3_9FIRM|nr:nickel pincer cofactor biosynthesis protein LarC [Selenihalanaerobacter shriftii]SJZ43272.1 hypothetical protein SAMN02745118_00829 [Selenihalanaerobacter shriftii]